MSIQKTIEQDVTKAMIAGDVKKRDLLRVVLAEMLRNTKVATDEEAIKVLKKQIESAKLCNTLEEIPILQMYLPEEMTEEVMKELLKTAYASASFEAGNIGAAMKLAREILGKDFDGKKVSQILKNL